MAISGCFDTDYDDSKTESEVSDLTLIENIQNDIDRDASLSKLIQRHSGIYFSIANKYFPEGKKHLMNVDRELVFNSKDYVIYNSALSFDKTRGAKFSTYVGNQARFFCLGQINKSSQYVPFEQSDFENIFSDETTVHENIDTSLSTKMMELIKGMPDERIYEIFRLRYIESKGKRATPWSKIYKKIPHSRLKNRHLTIQGCINLHNKALEEIRKKVRRSKEI